MLAKILFCSGKDLKQTQPQKEYYNLGCTIQKPRKFPSKDLNSLGCHVDNLAPLVAVTIKRAGFLLCSSQFITCIVTHSTFSRGSQDGKTASE